MGYRIVYQPIKKLRNREKNRTRLAALTGMWLILFLLMVEWYWPNGRDVLKDTFFVRDSAVIVSAMDRFVTDLKEEGTFGDTIADFINLLTEES